MAKVLTLDEVDLEGRTVLVRVDINSPLDPETNVFLDDTRIRRIIPTLNKLSKSKVILLAHQSRPGKKDFTSTLGHARELGRLLGRNVKWVDDIYGKRALTAIESLEDGELLMLNNVRMDDEEVSTKGDLDTMAQTSIVQNLSMIADAFVNDAFACAHRSSPSIVGFTNTLPCIAGELMNYELTKLAQALENPKRPCIAVLGGVKVDDSVIVADNMLRGDICDHIWVTGGVANLFLYISGINIGEININFLKNELGDAWNETISKASGLLTDFPECIIMPSDVALNIAGNRVDHSITDLPIDGSIFDMGITSIQSLSKAIKSAGTIILNGPAGVFEMSDFALGTVEMLNACAESNGYTVMGGGHTATLVSQRGLVSKMGHVSTGGGACLDLLAGRTLPGLASLEESAKQFRFSISKPLDHQ
ncbi:MAG: phosphoglycerate kinase [Euryarchaeota archaeon]|nr:phosphoglycerate kinase [Euryarchaeota archaeon]|tara:strand:+ start:1124 stop:2386 length:1263 start_codon:yes stop_codon:yes gene_type:complete